MIRILIDEGRASRTEIEEDPCLVQRNNHVQAQQEPEIQPNRVADELGGVAIACIKRVSGRRHWARIPDLATPAKPDVA